MKSYRVEWVIDVDADDPEQAARKAFAIMQREGTTANVFDVWEHDGTEEGMVRIDLEELDQ